MIKLKKIAAVALAATMCMGLSMTAFASTTVPSASNSQSAVDDIQSPNFIPGTSDIRPSNGTGEANDELVYDQTKLDPRSKTWESINTTPEVLDILAENGLGVPKGSTIVPIDYINVTGLSEDMANVVTFTLAASDFSSNKFDVDKYHAGDTIYAMMETGENTGVWEMVPGTLNDKGEVDFTIDHTGTIILVKAMKNGRLVQFTKDSNGNDVEPPVIVDPDDPQNPVVPTPDEPGTSTTPGNGQNANGTANGSANASGNAWTSPKTGEF